jgi:hypothetical protein
MSTGSPVLLPHTMEAMPMQKLCASRTTESIAILVVARVVHTHPGRLVYSLTNLLRRVFDLSQTPHDIYYLAEGDWL